MIRWFRKTYFTTRFFILFSIIVTFFVLSFIISWLFPVAQTLIVLFISTTVVDGYILFKEKQQLNIKRKLPNLFSLGDKNKVSVSIYNSLPLTIWIIIIDELPFQLQVRDFRLHFQLRTTEKKELEYYVRPLTRGQYEFRNINVFIKSLIGLICRKDIHELNASVAVYPSIIQMRKYELHSLPLLSTREGIKRLRKLGHSYEFEQVKNYVIGDDSRSINWKASGRRGELMVNQYEDERSQQVYSIIDKSRVMRMPFNGLTLLDYAINTSLVISNIVLQKHDRAGLITFSDKIGTVIKAERKSNQLGKILNALYNEQEHFLEANYELLYQIVRNIISNRSLIFLYSNFESVYAIERVLPILRKLNRFHIVVVMFFTNDEMTDLSNQSCKNIMDIYQQTMARKFVQEKIQIISELEKHGIHSILSKPEELSINTINKYLELKSRGLI